jgi:hypothetical protein
MDKKIQYAIGGVAIIGIIAYLYNKKKADDATKITTTAEAPTTNTGLITPPVVDEPNPIIATNVIINPDGTLVDTSLVSISTSPNVADTTSKDILDTGAVKPSTTTSSTTAVKFDGGFEYADGFGVDPVLGF